MTQKELFERDEYAALADDVDAIGRKEVATMFKGSESDFDPEDGAKWVSNCLDPKRNHKFGLEQITVIVNEARKRGSFAYLTWLLNKTYFEPPRPKTYEAEVRKAGDQLSTLLGQAKGVVEYLSQLEQQVKK
jgi:hypothetical protein